jgi:hypothetical protein
MRRGKVDKSVYFPPQTKRFRIFTDAGIEKYAGGSCDPAEWEKVKIDVDSGHKQYDAGLAIPFCVKGISSVLARRDIAGNNAYISLHENRRQLRKATCNTLFKSAAVKTQCGRKIAARYRLALQLHVPPLYAGNSERSALNVEA